MCWCPLWWVSHSRFQLHETVLIVVFGDRHWLNVPFLQQVLWICWVLLWVCIQDVHSFFAVYRRCLYFLTAESGIWKCKFTVVTTGTDLKCLLFFGVCCTGLVLVSLSGYLIEVTLSWANVFSLITLVNAIGLGVFLIFGDAQRVDVKDYSQITVIWPTFLSLCLICETLHLNLTVNPTLSKLELILTLSDAERVWTVLNRKNCCSGWMNSGIIKA